MNAGLTSHEIARVVHREIRLLLGARGACPVEVSPEDKLNEDLGLSSSDLVGLVSSLTVALGVDALTRSVSITDLRTVGDLCQIYEKLLRGAEEASSEMRALASSQKRAAVRRLRRKA